MRTPGYSPPEQDITSGMDVYALGVVLIQVVTAMPAALIAEGKVKAALQGPDGDHARMLDPTANWPPALALQLLQLGDKCRQELALRPKIGNVARQLLQLLQQAEAAAGSPVVASSADDAPMSFRCPITLQVMSDPVITADGHTYERAAIEHWLQVRQWLSRLHELGTL